MNKKAHVKGESQVNGEGTENANVMLLTPEMTIDEVKKVMEANPELANEFIQDEQAFMKKYGQHSEDGKKDELEKKENDGDPVPDEVNPDEAKKAEETINEFKEKVVPELQAQLDEAKKREDALRAEIEKAKKPADQPRKKEKLPDIDIPEISVPDIGDADLFSEEGQKSMIDAFNAMRKDFGSAVGVLSKLKERNQALEAELADIRDGVTVAKKEAVEASRKLDSSAKDADFRKRIDAELKEIDEMRKSNESVFGEFKRPIKQIEDDYLSFVEQVKTTAGIKGDTTLPDGRWTNAVERAIGHYNDPKSAIGADLRKRCPIEPPEDVDVLTTVYAVRNLRANTFERGETGDPFPIRYDKALKFYVMENPELSQKMKIEAEKANRDRIERAVDKRRSYAKEAPVKTEEAGPMEPTAEMQEVNRILQKPNVERSKEEKLYARKFLKTIPNPFSDDELDTLISMEA